jgi:hypothetical protein
LACAGGRCTPPSAIALGVSEERVEDVTGPPPVWRAGTGATTPSSFAFFVMRRAAVGAGMGSAEIDARAPRLGRTAEGWVELVGAADTCSFVFGRTNWRTGACSAGGERSENLWMKKDITDWEVYSSRTALAVSTL